MKIRTYIPFVEVPCGLIYLALVSHGVATGQMAPPPEVIGGLLWLLNPVAMAGVAACAVVSGAMKFVHPYILTDECAIRVFGHSFSNRVSEQIDWCEIGGLREVTSFSVVLLMSDGGTKRIPLYGMGPRAIREFVALIECEVRGNAANQASHATSEPAPGACPSSREG